MLQRSVTAIVRQRDPHDPESVTLVGNQLIAFARRILPSGGVDADKIARLRQLAARAKPSQIRRELLAWQLDYTDRAVPVLQRRAHVMMQWA
jgi:hypothetical protein